MENGGGGGVKKESEIKGVEIRWGEGAGQTIFLTEEKIFDCKKMLSKFREGEKKTCATLYTIALLMKMA